mmetsp:Transcript_47870/g.102271  ORF Transcript_47870/g.102271 Transcript_47870/m.102271 type:complete len:221 (+) Transcript_47870:90-752(+)
MRQRVGRNEPSELAPRPSASSLEQDPCARARRLEPRPGAATLRGGKAVPGSRFGCQNQSAARREGARRLANSGSWAPAPPADRCPNYALFLASSCAMSACTRTISASAQWVSSFFCALASCLPVLRSIVVVASTFSSSSLFTFPYSCASSERSVMDRPDGGGLASCAAALSTAASYARSTEAVSSSASTVSFERTEYCGSRRVGWSADMDAHGVRTKSES